MMRTSRMYRVSRRECSSTGNKTGHGATAMRIAESAITRECACITPGDSFAFIVMPSDKLCAVENRLR